MNFRYFNLYDGNQIGLLLIKIKLENIEEAIKKGKSRETGKIECIRRRKTQRNWQDRVYKTKKNTEKLAR